MAQLQQKYASLQVLNQRTNYLQQLALNLPFKTNLNVVRSQQTHQKEIKTTFYGHLRDMTWLLVPYHISIQDVKLTEMSNEMFEKLLRIYPKTTSFKIKRAIMVQLVHLIDMAAQHDISFVPVEIELEAMDRASQKIYQPYLSQQYLTYYNQYQQLKNNHPIMGWQLLYEASLQMLMNMAINDVLPINPHDAQRQYQRIVQMKGC